MNREDLLKAVLVDIEIPQDHEGATATALRSAILNPDNESIKAVVNDIEEEVNCLYRASRALHQYAERFKP